MKYIKWVLFVGILCIAAYSFLSNPDFKTISKKETTGYINDLMSMENSPVKNEDGLAFFEPDEKWVIEAKLEKLPKNQNFKMQMTDTSKADAILVGKLKFEIDGKPYAMLVFEEGETLLLPFKDKSNGSVTYDGGRYINIPAKDLDEEHIHVDFNRAHNFYCAYNESYICPVPPIENKIETEVNAGEKTFNKDKK
jgi:uncharacterized protein